MLTDHNSSISVTLAPSSSPSWLQRGARMTAWTPALVNVAGSAAPGRNQIVVETSIYDGLIAADDFSMAHGDCPTPSLCTFEGSVDCGHTRDLSNVREWTVHQGSELAVTDHTLRSTFGHFLYLNTTSVRQSRNSIARIHLPVRNATPNACLTFWWRAHGDQSELSVYRWCLKHESSTFTRLNLAYFWMTSRLRKGHAQINTLALSKEPHALHGRIRMTHLLLDGGIMSGLDSPCSFRTIRQEPLKATTCASRPMLQGQFAVDPLTSTSPRTVNWRSAQFSLANNYRSIIAISGTNPKAFALIDDLLVSEDDCTTKGDISTVTTPTSAEIGTAGATTGFGTTLFSTSTKAGVGGPNTRYWW
ncbi:hypothetical protein MRX96_015054 [Rhipicephalus microplus]